MLKSIFSSLFWLALPLCVLGIGTMALARPANPYITISNPITGAVYQQGTDGKAKIIIHAELVKGLQSYRGNFVGSVQAELQQLDLVTGNPLGTSPINVYVTTNGTSVSGEQIVDKGWYKLTISNAYISSASNSSQQITRTIKVGVGEVFVIAGQSNAQGGFGVADGTQYMDAVRVSPDLIPENQRTIPEQMSNQYIRVGSMKSTQEDQSLVFPGRRAIGPLGPDLWYWASVGAQLAQQCQAPVAFFNAAFGGTTITNWVTSTNRDAQSSGSGSGRYNAGAPFYFFKDLSDIVRSTYGFRAILWMQGETDTKAIILRTQGSSDEQTEWAPRELVNRNNVIIPAPYSDESGLELRAIRNDLGPTDYVNKIKGVIEMSRNNGRAPWIIAKTSYITVTANGSRSARTAAQVQEGQEVFRLTQLGVPDVVQGPDTDGLNSTYRRPQAFNQFGTPIGDEPVHFNTAGSSIVASLWVPIIKNHINSPVAPVTPQSIGTEPRLLTVQSDGTVSAPTGFLEYRWVADSDLLDAYAPVATTREVIQGNVSSPQVVNGKTILPAGEYRAFIKNGQGNFILTQSLELPTIDPGTPPPPSNCKNGNENSAGNRTPNGAAVGGFGNSSEFMEYTFSGQTGGSTTFSIHYASGDGTAGIDLVVNGTPYSMRPPGTASWTPNADASTTITLNPGDNTIRIQGSGQGNFSYDRLCIGSGGGGTPPSGCGFSIAPTVSNGNPACGQGITLFANCSGADCGGATFSWNGSNGQTYTGTSPGFTAPTGNGSVTYTLTASKAGCGNQVGSTGINVTDCGGTPPTGFGIAGVQLNCSTGVVTINLNGSNGNPVEYRAPGLQDWSTNPLVVPSWQRNGTNFTFYVRQSGNGEANTGFTSNCGGDVA